jgi:hypothetical protein
LGRTSGEKRARQAGQSVRHRPAAPVARRAAAGAPVRLAVVIVAVFLGWMALSWLGGRLGLPPGLALLIDVAALATFGWGLYALVGIWRTRQREGH